MNRTNVESQQDLFETASTKYSKDSGNADQPGQPDREMDYIDFQDRDTPLAYLITFTCYGTWLHGDTRYSVSRTKNAYGSPRVRAADGLREKELSSLKHPPTVLNKKRRHIVAEAIKEVCRVRETPLHALNVRSNHAHIVHAAVLPPERSMTMFKAYATRALRENQLARNDERIWSRHGSTRYLWTDNHVETAIDYVLYSQDFGIPEF